MKAIKIYTDLRHPNYIVKMEDGKYRLATQALTNVYSEILPTVFEQRLKSKSWDGRPTAEEITGNAGTILLNTLNASLGKLNQAAVALGRLGGKAGTGAAKRRDIDYSALARKRWEK